MAKVITFGEIMLRLARKAIIDLFRHSPSAPPTAAAKRTLLFHSQTSASMPRL
jgi:hypothetical protein